MTFYLALLTPLVAGVIAVYAIFPDLFDHNAPRWRRAVAAGLIALGTATSGWSAYSGVRDQGHLEAWQAVGAVHEHVNQIWRDFQQAMFDPNRFDKGLDKLKEIQELIKQGRFAEETKATEGFGKFYAPDKAKLEAVIKQIDLLPVILDRAGVPYDLKYRAFYFGLTVKTLAWRHSKNAPLSPSLLFAAVAAEERQMFKNQLTLKAEWSEFLWYTGYFRPADFGPPRRILSLGPAGQLVVDASKFDEDFLLSRAMYLVSWFESVTQ